jgi:tetratricopeptide (TPR) repeat protein
MGLAYTGLGKFKKAIEAYEKAIEIHPYYGTAYYNMHIIISFFIRFNINGFFISLNCLLKLAFMIILITF